MARTYGSVTFYCQRPGCVTEVTYRRDDHLPNPEGWICDACIDQDLEQAAIECAKREPQPLALVGFPFDRIKRMSDFN